MSFTRTLGGKRKGFIRRGGRRAWSVDVSVARPGEVSTLETVARGVGPYGWYPPESVKGNLLSPQASAFGPVPANAVDGGLVALPDGSVARSVVPTGTVSVGDAHGGREHVPVRPGEPVSVGAWGLGGIRFTGVWTDSLGVTAGSWSTGAFTHSGWKFQQQTLTPPAGAAFLVLWLSAGSQYALPSVSWGTVAARELGTGCPHAVIHSPSHAPVALWEGANYTNSSYSVTEVG